MFLVFWFWLAGALWTKEVHEEEIIHSEPMDWTITTQLEPRIEQEKALNVV